MSYFEYQDQPETPDVSRFHITSVQNLIPISVWFRDQDEEKHIMGYIDYSSNQVLFSDSALAAAQLSDAWQEFNEAVLQYLRARHLQFDFVPPSATADDLTTIQHLSSLKRNQYGSESHERESEHPED